MFKRILVCSDGSDCALKATRAAAEIAQRFDASVTLLTIFQPLALSLPNTMAPEIGKDVETVIRGAEEIQSAIIHQSGKAFEDYKIKYKPRRELGHPVDKIIEVAEEEKADLIVLGSRGLGGFQRFLLGSVSHGVLNHAHCPVLIMR